MPHAAYERATMYEVRTLSRRGDPGLLPV